MPCIQLEGWMLIHARLQLRPLHEPCVTPCTDGQLLRTQADESTSLQEYVPHIEGNEVDFSPLSLCKSVAQTTAQEQSQSAKVAAKLVLNMKENQKEGNQKEGAKSCSFPAAWLSPFRSPRPDGNVTHSCCEKPQLPLSSQGKHRISHGQVQPLPF